MPGYRDNIDVIALRDWRMSARLAERGLEPVDRACTAAGLHHAIADVVERLDVLDSSDRGDEVRAWYAEEGTS